MIIFVYKLPVMFVVDVVVFVTCLSSLIQFPNSHVHKMYPWLYIPNFGCIDSEDEIGHDFVWSVLGQLAREAAFKRLTHHRNKRTLQLSSAVYPRRRHHHQQQQLLLLPHYHHDHDHNHNHDQDHDHSCHPHYINLHHHYQPPHLCRLYPHQPLSSSSSSSLSSAFS